MTSENLIKETAKAIAAIYGEPSLWEIYQIDARAAIQVIAPTVLDTALTRLEWALTEGADPILAVRAVKKGYSHDQ